MSITAAELLVKVGWDDSEVDRGSKDTESKMGKLTGVLKTGALAVGAAGAATGAAMVSSMMTVEDAFMPIGTLLGRNSKEFEELQGAMKGVISSSPRSAEELGAGAYALLSAGVSGTDNVMNAMKASMDLADAGLGTVAQSTDIVTSAMNSFASEGLTAEDAAKKMFGTIALGKTTVADLSQGFGGIAPLAASAGVSFNDMMASVAALTSTGKPTSAVYTNLSAILSNVIKPSTDAAKAAEELGLNFNAAHLKSVGFPKFLDEIKEATGGNTETMARLFGSTEALGAVISLTGDQAEKFQESLTGVGEAGEDMAERAAEANNTLSNRFAIMKNKVMIILNDIGVRGFDWLAGKWEQFGPAVMTVVNEITGGFRAFFAAFKAGDGDVTSSGFPGFMEKMANAAHLVIDYMIAAWPTVKETMLAVFQIIQTEVIPPVMQGLETLSSIISQVVQVVQDNWPAISEVMIAVGEVVGAVLEAFWQMTVSTIDVVTQIWDKWGDEIMAVVSGIFSVLVPLISGALNIIRDVFKAVTALMQGDWDGAWKAIKQIFIDLWAGIWGALTAAWDALGPMIKTALGKAEDGIKEVWNRIIGFVTGIPGRVLGAVSGMWDGIWTEFKSVINNIVGAWNGLSFTMPSFDTHIPGVGTVGGFSISPPNLPYLAKGGLINRGGYAVVGEQGPETVFLPTGANVIPNGGGGTRMFNVYMAPGSDGDDVVRALKRWERTNGALPFKVAGSR